MCNNNQKLSTLYQTVISPLKQIQLYETSYYVWLP